MATNLATNVMMRTRASAPAGVVIVRTLQLAHPAWPADFYLADYPGGFDAVIEGGTAVHFQQFPFTVVLPVVDGAGQQDMQVALTNADQTIADAVRIAHTQPETSITATYREFLNIASDAPQSAPIRLSLDTVQITDDLVAGVAGRSDVLNRRFPGIWYDVQHFPGLDR